MKLLLHEQIKCQRCFHVDMLWFLILLITHVATRWLVGLPLPPPGVALKGAGAVVVGASADVGEQLAHHHARLDAQRVITARRGSPHIRPRSALSRISLMSFCHLLCTSFHCFSTIVFLHKNPSAGALGNSFYCLDIIITHSLHFSRQHWVSIQTK